MEDLTTGVPLIGVGRRDDGGGGRVEGLLDRGATLCCIGVWAAVGRDDGLLVGDDADALARGWTAAIPLEGVKDREGGEELDRATAEIVVPVFAGSVDRALAGSLLVRAALAGPALVESATADLATVTSLALGGALTCSGSDLTGTASSSKPPQSSSISSVAGITDCIARFAGTMDIGDDA